MSVQVTGTKLLHATIYPYGYISGPEMNTRKEENRKISPSKDQSEQWIGLKKQKFWLSHTYEWLE